MSIFRRKQFNKAELHDYLQKYPVPESGGSDSGWMGLIEQVLGPVVYRTAVSVETVPNYQLDTLLDAVIAYSGSRVPDLQLTMIVWLLQCATRGTHRASRDGAAEELIRKMDLPNDFKLLVKRTLFDKGGLHVPFLTIYD